MQSRQFIATLLLLCSLLFAACTTPAAPSSSSTEDTGAGSSSSTEDTGAAAESSPPAAPTGTLTAALPLEPNSVNPPNGADRMAELVIIQVFDALLGVDFTTGEIMPALATEWSISEDGTTYEFTLR